jgi:hypothetical protein
LKFAAIIEYADNRGKIAQIRPMHRQYQTKLKEEGTSQYALYR